MGALSTAKLDHFCPSVLFFTKLDTPLSLKPPRGKAYSPDIR